MNIKINLIKTVLRRYALTLDLIESSDDVYTKGRIKQLRKDIEQLKEAISDPVDKITMKKGPKTIEDIIADNGNTIATACTILEYRPNLQNKKRQGYYRRKESLEKLPPHNGYHYGFEDGYKYAIERLQKHSSTPTYLKVDTYRR